MRAAAPLPPQAFSSPPILLLLYNPRFNLTIPITNNLPPPLPVFDEDFSPIQTPGEFISPRVSPLFTPGLTIFSFGFLNYFLLVFREMRSSAAFLNPPSRLAITSPSRGVPFFPYLARTVGTLLFPKVFRYLLQAYPERFVVRICLFFSRVSLSSPKPDFW